MPSNKRKRSLSRQQKLKQARNKRRAIRVNYNNSSNLNGSEIQNANVHSTTNNSPPTIPDLCGSIDRKKSMEEALGFINRTKINGTENEHRACVCCICDSFIIGVEPICWLSKEDIKNKQQYLSVSYLEEMIEEHFPEELRNYYKIEDQDLDDLLLSPRAQTCNGNFMSCDTCHRNIKHKDRIKPPRFAISNAWAIGRIPASVVGTEIDQKLAALVNI